MTINNKTDRPSAFPLLLPNDKNWNAGISKRFYAACAAMQGILAGKYYNTLVNLPTENVSDGFPEPIAICEDAYVFADELLKQENNDN